MVTVTVEPAWVMNVLPLVKAGMYPTKSCKTCAEIMDASPVEAVDIFEAAKASLVGMKAVIEGVASRPIVWPDTFVRETKVVSPVD